MEEKQRVVASWDAEYRSGRYQGESPEPFTQDILAAARADALTQGVYKGVYIGCGNGRNYLALVGGGLDLVGLDISPVAIEQLAARVPERRSQLICGDIDALPVGLTCPLLIGIQVFQHGSRVDAHAHIRAAQARLGPGGLFCLRVNATDTDIWPDHEVAERNADGGLTARYLEGPKRGLNIHFFSADELHRLFDPEFETVSPLRLDRRRRTPPKPGAWSQWEAIWRKGAR